MLTEWLGELGDEYTIRNNPNIADVKDALLPLIPGGVQSVLEVGCNKGANLVALEDYFQVCGVEPNFTARVLAIKQGLDVCKGVADMLPYPDEAFDLVFTAGVLIHVPPEEIDQALDELWRVSRKFVLMIEYDGHEEVEYRGSSIWKRDYGDLFNGVCGYSSGVWASRLTVAPGGCAISENGSGDPGSFDEPEVPGEGVPGD